MFDKNPGGERLFAIQLVFLLLGCIFGLLRAYVKIVMIKKVTIDDYLMFVAILAYTAYSIIALHGIVAGGTGLHRTDLTPEGAAIALRAWWLCEVLYTPIVLLIRTSVAAFLLRIANNRVHQCIIYVDLAVIWAVSVAFFFILVFQCSPVSYFWMQALGDKASCIDQRVVPAATIAHSVISAVSDWVLGLLPIAMLWNVQLNKRTKATISFLLGLGLLAGIALIVRIPYVKILEISVDFLFETIDVAIWSVMEPGLGIIAGCAATLRPLFKAWGFGPASAARKNYGNSRTKTGSSKTSRTRQSHKPGSRGGSLANWAARGRGPYDTAEDEIELTTSSRGRDVEFGPVDKPPLPQLLSPTPANAQTSVGFFCEAVPPSGSSSERALPVQGIEKDLPPLP